MSRGGKNRAYMCLCKQPLLYYNDFKQRELHILSSIPKCPLTDRRFASLRLKPKPGDFFIILFIASVAVILMFSMRQADTGKKTASIIHDGVVVKRIRLDTLDHTEIFEYGGEYPGVIEAENGRIRFRRQPAPIRSVCTRDGYRKTGRSPCACLRGSSLRLPALIPPRAIPISCCVNNALRHLRGDHEKNCTKRLIDFIGTGIILYRKLVSRKPLNPHSRGKARTCEYCDHVHTVLPGLYVCYDSLSSEMCSGRFAFWRFFVHAFFSFRGITGAHGHAGTEIRIQQAFFHIGNQRCRSGFHNTGQILMASLMMRNTAVFAYLPVLLLAG